MTTDHDRLHDLLERLHRLELHVPQPHERPIVEVGRRALAEQIRLLAHRLHRADYLHPVPVRARA